ncbi:hypothetical protein MNBD_NITROSPINAE01-1200 [hydrothermal vent metagenome]|uniref:F5/8 type C domain-containing protein n=1 Tax=hydrothermal vent metagenome TaxID=652676 RepID=A0A3B1C1Q7_9ZZZZ
MPQKRLYFAITALVFIIAVLIRAPYIAEYHDVVNLDEATVGLMAFDILDGDPPLFFYGQKYFGPFEGLFLAVAFLIFPVTPLTLRITIAFISLLAIFIFWRGAGKLMDKKGALFTLSFFAIPPVLLSIWSSLASGGHIGGLLLGSMIFYATSAILKSPERKSTTFLGYGVLLGFAMWMHPGLLLYIASAFAMVLVADWRLLTSRAIPVSIAGALIGGAPFWIATIIEKLNTFEFGQERTAGKPLSVFLNDFYISFKNIPGVIGIDILPETAQLPVLGMFIVALLASLFFTFRKEALVSKSSLASIFGWVLIITTTIFYGIVDANKWGWVQYRYYIPLIAGMALVLGHLCMEASKRKKIVGTALFAIFMTINLAINAVAYFDGRYHYYRMDTRLDERFFTYAKLLPDLEKLGVTRTYLRLYDDACVIFQSDRKIIGVAFNDSRLRKYSLEVDSAKSPAFSFLKGEGAGFGSKLATKMAEFSFHEGKAYNVYYDIRPPKGVFVPVDTSNVKATASIHNENIHNALDGNFDTFWNIERPQQGNESILLDFGKPTKVSRIDLIPTWLTDTPKHIIIEKSKNGQEWAKIVETDSEGSMYWSGPHIVQSVWEGFSQYIFPTVETRYLRIRQAGQTSAHWHVREIFIYERTDNNIPDSADMEWDDVLSFLRQNNINHVISDFYFSANIIKRSGGDIWANIRLNKINEDKRAKWVFDVTELQAIAVHKRDLSQVKNFINTQGWQNKIKKFGDYLIFYNLKVGGAKSVYKKVRWTGSHLIGADKTG